MFLLNISIIIFSISLILIALGFILKNKLLKLISGFLIIAVMFIWIIIISKNFDEDNKRQQELNNTNTTNSTINSTENLTMDNITNLNATAEEIDITPKFKYSSFYKSGKIYKTANNKIYFSSEGNKYFVENDEEFNFKDGRTNEDFKFEDIKEGYIIDFSINKNIYIFKNITGNELKKDLLYNLALDDNANLTRAGISDIGEITKLNNTDGLVVFKLYDIANFNDEEIGLGESFEVTFKFTKNTKYHSKGNYTYDLDTLENSKDTIMWLRLDPKTINNEYPEVLIFESSDS